MFSVLFSKLERVEDKYFRLLQKIMQSEHSWQMTYTNPDKQ